MAALADAEFDCVVSAHEMPGRNGIEFLELVREEYPDLPFVLFTGKGSEAVASDAISAGVTDYLQKGSGTEQYELLANRIVNAVDHGGTEGTVTVGGLDDGFFIDDDGPEIPEADRDSVFNAGYSTADAGNGFRLSIVRDVAEAHGWDVRGATAPTAPTAGHGLR